MIKLSVGSKSIETLAGWQNIRASQSEDGKPYHITRMFPRKRNELLQNGSIYWVIKGIIQCRNRIIDLQEIQTEDGRKACKIVLDNNLIPVIPTPKRAFQGWRYLQQKHAPKDLTDISGAGGLPAHIRNKLVELGAW